jgi:hypothetical protein
VFAKKDTEKAPTTATTRSRVLTESDLLRIQKSLASTSHLQVNFQISRTSQYISEMIASSGKAHFEKPNKFIWDVQSSSKPTKKYFNGKDLWVHYYKQNKADLVKPKGEMYRLISQISDAVLRPKNLLKRFNLDSTNSKVDGSTATIRLVPKKSSDEFKSVILTVKTDLKYVKSIKLISREANPQKKVKENSTTIAFSKVLRKGKNSAMFSFNPPKGTTTRKLN